jgi:hypothetical protein
LKIKQLVKFVCVLLLLVLILATQACDSTGFNTFSIKDGIQGFNFEYPSSYSLIRIDLSNTADARYTTIGLGATINGVASEIYVYIWPTTVGMESASAVLDTLLANASTTLTNFALVDKTTPTVNGLTAQGASFTATQTDASTTTSIPPAYYRVTCFIQNNLIVEIDMTCDVSLKNATQSDYDHLLDTMALIGS